MGMIEESVAHDAITDMMSVYRLCKSEAFSALQLP